MWHPTTTAPRFHTSVPVRGPCRHVGKAATERSRWRGTTAGRRPAPSPTTAPRDTARCGRDSPCPASRRHGPRTGQTVGAQVLSPGPGQRSLPLRSTWGGRGATSSHEHAWGSPGTSGRATGRKLRQGGSRFGAEAQQERDRGPDRPGHGLRAGVDHHRLRLGGHERFGGRPHDGGRHRGGHG
ncbi:hypothetical protein MINT15_01340 [Saccharomonospora viridis]|uniref:Uncharacterized protein n=1 Tax=Saccharomonospora viridis TaxID=1852 RepID=A0A837DD89_9PSEU|nr:hypothetical protein MINT15_01340 [Saccharomonospora viridis]